MKTLIGMVFLLVISVCPAGGQNSTVGVGKIVGNIRDAQTFEPLEFAGVFVMNVRDSSMVKGTVTDSTGNFSVESLPFGFYYLKLSFVGYDILTTETFFINALHPEKKFGGIRLSPNLLKLKTVNINAKRAGFTQNADTIQYNANAYKTHPDATAEDLVNKMPGVTTDNQGNVTAHGEQVQQILVDGKPFFGDDPIMALKNLPADMIDKIQVYDKLSEQAQFTGFDDGQTVKTINIMTKKGRSDGQFGKLYGGYGTDGRYNAGGTANVFKGNRRISIIGLTNDINQQNFTSQDLLGVTGGSTSGQNGGAGGGGGASNNFLVGPQPGVSTVNSLGINYSDQWGTKLKLTASCFLNNSNNINLTNLNRNYITSQDVDVNLHYDEADKSQNDNYNQRFNARIEYSIDSANSLVITPKFGSQQYNSVLSVTGNTFHLEDALQSSTNNAITSAAKGYTFTNNTLFRHKFKKSRRTFSVGLETDANNQKGTGSLNSLSQYFTAAENDSTLLDQHSHQNANGYTFAPTFTYTEPLDSVSRLQFSYVPSYTKNYTDKETDNFVAATQTYSQLDTILSNKYNNNYLSQRGGVGYRINKKKYNFMATVNYQYARLFGSETFPVAFNIQKDFRNVLPQSIFNYKFSKGTNLRIIYRTSTNIPSVSQLQNVINNSNPILLSTGNINLKQDFEQTVIIRYGKTKSEKAMGLFTYLYANYAQNYISNSTIIPTKDTVINNDVTLKKGSQLSMPVNLNGYFNLRSTAIYALPLSKIKSNLSFNAGLIYNRIPGLINNRTNLANNENISGGPGLSSNISPSVDYTISYAANYSIVNNSLEPTANNNYFYHTATVKFNWILKEKFVLNTNVVETLYSGLSKSYNQNYTLWTASFGYKMLKKHALEMKATVFDILNQNNSISRTVTQTYIQDNQTNVLHRYYMLTLTYTIKNFKSET